MITLFGAGKGMGYANLRKYSKIEAFSRTASGTILTIPTLKIFGVFGKANGNFGLEFFRNYWEGASGRPHIGDRIFGKGLNVGVGAGWFGVQTITITAPNPSGKQLFQMVRHWH